MAIPENHVLVLAPGHAGRVVSPVLSIRLLESRRDSKTPEAGFVEKSCAGSKPSDRRLSCSLGILCAWLAGSGWWESEFLRILVSLAGLYFIVSFGAAFAAGWRGGWRYVLVLPLVFATYHLSYALGFLLALTFQPVAWDRPSYLRKILTAITR